MKQPILLALAALLVTLYACGGAKKSTDPEIGHLSAEEKYFFEIQNTRDTFATLQIDGRIGIESPDFTGTGNFVARIKNDSVFWLRVTKFGFEIARASVTPEKITYINRLERTYLVADTKQFVQNQLNIPLDFQSIMRLMLGDVPMAYDMLPPLLQARDTLKVNARMEDMAGRMQLNYVKPHIKPVSVYGGSDKGHTLSVKHKDFRDIGRVHSFPTQRNYKFDYGRSTYKVDMEVSNIRLNEIYTYPMEIPQNYTVVNW